MNAHQHWETVYHTKDSAQVSWYTPHLETSLQLIKRLAPSTQASILDVGSGTSTLPDDLLAAGYLQLNMLDISEQALEIAQARLGNQAARVHWLVGDVLDLEFASHSFDIWHDRAVFHFLTEKAQRERYVEQVFKSVKPNGHVIMATFGTDGPKQCSGLDVIRYDSHSLHREFGATFRLLDSLIVNHQTPSGLNQQFLYCYCRVE